MSEEHHRGSARVDVVNSSNFTRLMDMVIFLEQINLAALFKHIGVNNLPNVNLEIFIVP